MFFKFSSHKPKIKRGVVGDEHRVPRVGDVEGVIAKAQLADSVLDSTRRYTE